MRQLSLALLALAACGGAASRPHTVAVTGAWARTADSGTVTAAYFTLINGTANPVTFTEASSPIAASVSLHQTMDMGGMVHMMPLDSAQVLTSGDSLVLAEGAKHLMVSGLTRGLAAGDSLPITLKFADGSTMQVRAAVRAP